MGTDELPRMEAFGFTMWAMRVSRLSVPTVFAAIREEPGATEGGGNAVVTALRSLALLRTDRALRRYVIARALLLSAALAPPVQ